MGYSIFVFKCVSGVLFGNVKCVFEHSHYSILQYGAVKSMLLAPPARCEWYEVWDKYVIGAREV